MQKVALAIFLMAIFAGCEDPPIETSPLTKQAKSTSTKVASLQSQASTSTSASATAPTSFKDPEDEQRMSFNESPEEAMAKVRASLGLATASTKRAVVAEIPSQQNSMEAIAALMADSGKPTPPPEIQQMLNKAKDNKAMAQLMESVLSDLPQAEKIPANSANKNKGGLISRNDAASLSSGNSSRRSQGSGGLNAGVRTPKAVNQNSGLKFENGTFNFDYEPEATPSPSSLKLIQGSRPRGYTMLYMMHPRARTVSEQQVQTLIDAMIENVYIGVLTDGTFGRDFDYLKNVLSRLSNAGRHVTFVAYLSNGATMRAYKDTPITAGFSNISPESFRELIQSDKSTQEKFRQLAKDVAPLFAHNQSLSSRNINIAVPMLEDNLDRDSYSAMRSIASSVLGNLSVQIVRNPCLGCYKGNDDDGLGDAVEEHGESAHYRIDPGDGFTFDGEQFLYPGEANAGTGFDSAMALISEAEDRGALYIGLWRADWQGLSNGPLVHPDNRPYRTGGPTEIAAEIRLLRSGLDQN